MSKTDADPGWQRAGNVDLSLYGQADRIRDAYRRVLIYYHGGPPPSLAYDGLETDALRWSITLAMRSENA